MMAAAKDVADKDMFAVAIRQPLQPGRGEPAGRVCVHNGMVSEARELEAQAQAMGVQLAPCSARALEGVEVEEVKEEPEEQAEQEEK